MEPDELEQHLARSNRTKRIVLGAGMVVLSGLCCFPWLRIGCSMSDEIDRYREQRAEYEHTLTPEQAARLETALARMEELALGAESRFEAGRASLDAVRTGSSMSPEPCPFSLPLRAESRAETDFDQGMTGAFLSPYPGQHSFPWSRLEANAPSQSALFLREQAARLRESLTRTSSLENLASDVELAEALAETPPGYEVVVVAESWREPYIPPGTDTFMPGEARGQAFLFDYARGAFACVASFEATTASQTIEYTQHGVLDDSQGSGMLRFEFTVQVERALALAPWRRLVADGAAGMAVDGASAVDGVAVDETASPTP